jgi:hypothetical protein
MPTTKKSADKALATTVEKFSIVATDNKLDSEAIAEELDGLGALPFDHVKFPTGGNTNFEIPDEDDEDNYVSTPEITGVIAYHHAANGYWDKGFDGSSEPPTCSSVDGKVGLNTETGEVIECAKCPYNQFGSGGQNNSKACKNVHRIYILRDDNPVPLLLSLPPTSLRSFKNYIAKKLLMRGRKSNQVVTRLTLKKEKSQSGMPYSKVVFEKVGNLNSEQCVSAAKAHEALKAMEEASPEAITANDYNTQQQTAVSIDINPEDDIPPIKAEVQAVAAESPAPAVAARPETPNTGFEFLDPTTPTADENPFA